MINTFFHDTEYPKDKRTPEDGKIILDLIEAIHAAEKKQAESDASIFAEEKRILKVGFCYQLNVIEEVPSLICILFNDFLNGHIKTFGEKWNICSK